MINFIKNLFRPAPKKSGLVYIVDDSVAYAFIIGRYLEEGHPGVNVRIFPTGESCLQELDHEPDLIIMDYYLNSKNADAANGLENIKKIRKQKFDQNIVVLSGQQDMDVVIDAVKLYNCSYIAKDIHALPRVGELVREIYSQAS